MATAINPSNTAGNYIMPVNFGYVEEQITRSGAPNVVHDGDVGCLLLLGLEPAFL